MAVPEQRPYIEHVANGVTTSFSLGFVCDSADKLVVTVNDLPTNVGDWSFSDGSVVFQYPPLSDSTVKIWRNSPLARSTTFKTYDNSLNPNSLNLDLDKIWLVMQELNVKNFISDNKLQELLDKLVDGDINGLPAEVLARIAGDESIKSLVNLEEIRAHQAESNLNIRIDNESLLANQNILAEKQRAEAAEQSLQIQVNSVGVGNKAYKTYAEMDADKANLSPKTKVTVTNDATASNNGDWQWDGVVFTKSAYDLLTQSKSYTDSFATVKSKVLTTENLFDLTENGHFVQPVSAGATLALNYPVALAGVLTRFDNGLSGDNKRVTLTYRVFSTNKTYTTTYDASAWKAWNSDLDLASVQSSLPSQNGFIWQRGQSTTSVTFDPDTKELRLFGYIVAPYSKISGSNRIRIEGTHTFTMTGQTNALWLDLSAVPSDGNITTANIASIIKLGAYSDSSTIAYRARFNQIPLVIYDGFSNRCKEVGNFISVNNIGSSVADTALYFDKTDVRLNVYFPSANGGKVRISMLHQVVPAGQTGSIGSNSDLWRIYTANLCDKDFVVGDQIVNEGEWECAIQHTIDTQAEGVAKDFVGGYHGDEVLSTAYFTLDGVKQNADFLQTGVKKFTEICLAQKSTIYFQGTTTPLAEHWKYVTFNANGVNVKQKLLIVGDTSVRPLYMCLFPIMRVVSGTQYLESSARSTDYFTQIDDNSVGGLPSRYSVLQANLGFKQWGSSGLSSKVTVHNMTQLVQTNNAYIQITSSPAYNKLYVSPLNINSAYTIPANTVLESDVTYQLDKTS